MDTRSAATPRTSWTVSTGIVLGRNHAALRRNRQDALASGRGEWGAFGVVSDGCGSATDSEVGAKLTVAVAGNLLRASLRGGVSPTQALREAHEAVVSVLRRVAMLCATSVWEAEAVDHQHLLATLVAFAVTERETAVLMIGDGTVRVDDDVVARSHEDAPGYVSCGGAALARAFSGARSVAIATDGFDLESFDAIAAIRAADLTRHMTIRQRRSGAFTDDAAIVVARREVTS